MPALAEAHDRIGDEVLFVSVTTEDVGGAVTEETVANWWRENDGDWLVAADVTAELAPPSQRWWLPERSRHRRVGTRPWATSGTHTTEGSSTASSEPSTDDKTRRPMTDISLATNVPFAVTAGVATFFAVRVPALAGVRRVLRELRRRRFCVGPWGGSPRACGRGRCAGDVRAARWRHRPDRLLDAGKHHRLRDARRRIAHRFRATRGLRAHPVDPVPLPKRRTGVFGFGLFGAGYALAGAGCVAPVFLGVVAGQLRSRPRPQ